MTRFFLKQALIACLAVLPLWAAPLVKTATVEYTHNGVTLEGYVAYRDDIVGKRPGILIAHAWKGLGDYEKSRARQLAEMGYVAFALDMYGKGVRPNNPKDAGQLSGFYKKNRPLMRSRAQAGLDRLKAFPAVDPAQCAVIGYCFGGTVALELARSGADVKGTVSFHGGLENTSANTVPILSKFLILHGAEDPYVPAEQVLAFEQEMKDAQTDWQLIAYSGAVHAFTDPSSGNDKSTGAAYNERADKRSFEAMTTFFREIFVMPSASKKTETAVKKWVPKAVKKAATKK
jgi:dienelactone hydrolase